MIVDNIKNADLYFGMGARIEKALKYLQKTDFAGMKPGRYEIDGDNVYALVQEYESKPLADGKWEAHRRYIDVQFVAGGTEQMGYAYGASLQVSKEYDSEGDYLLYQGNGSMIVCTAGTFVIFGPEDVHMPCMAVNVPKPVKKVVVKVKV